MNEKSHDKKRKCTDNNNEAICPEKDHEKYHEKTFASLMMRFLLPLKDFDSRVRGNMLTPHRSKQFPI